MLETLYKRNVNGTINQWSVIVENDGYYTEFRTSWWCYNKIR